MATRYSFPQIPRVHSFDISTFKVVELTRLIMVFPTNKNRSDNSLRGGKRLVCRHEVLAELDAEPFDDLFDLLTRELEIH